MIKKALVVVVLVALGGAGYWWMNAPVGDSGPEARRGNAAMQMRAGITGQRWGRGGAATSTIQVEALDVTMSAHSPTLPLLATVAAKRQEIITAPQLARVEDILVEPGDRVEAGQPLLRLSAESLQWALRQQQAAITQLEATIRIAARQHEVHQEELEQARANYQREVNLRQQGFSNESSVQTAADALRSAELQVAVYEDESVQRRAQLEQARIELEQVQSQIEDLTPTAPFDAEVVAIQTAPRVQVASGANLMTLIDRESIYASTQIPLSAYRELRAGNAEARAIVNGVSYPVRISRLSATANAGAVAMELTLPDDIPVLINETIELDLALPAVDAYALPQDALYYGDQLYRIEDGRLRAVSVSVLGYQQRGDQPWALVTGDGLDGGMTVLTTRLSQPTNGTPVTVVNGAHTDNADSGAKADIGSEIQAGTAQ
ncbi:efflux RND transporter periplasmic adaptor subunit [Saccharospirillum salsuginis]|uniref:HlyD family secretion protein n=1 Tax=Saccharospirillum salsuginis TaxID=418750 RepID=A0A918KJG9_9GAMM|nr:HlyD family efflux transporter periplasmic adaptor subunit [Saccharospirillum salsuginis]GGX65277.1 hypothetical protein GCM10007392_36430 [Saccharospirillum salsuginis]